MEKYLGALLIAALIILAKNFWPAPKLQVDASTQPDETLQAFQPIITQSRFEDKLEAVSEVIFRKTVYKDDPEKELGEETILDEGADGKKITIIKITYYEGEEYSRETISTEVEEPKEKIILRGTKIVWKTLETADGTVRYWKKLRVWATHYDSKCPGCNETTATGLKAGKGVIAVDPSIIKLRSRVYIPGYGFAIAGDTGGSIRGQIIDLGFDDARTSGWRAKFIDIYLL